MGGLLALALLAPWIDTGLVKGVGRLREPRPLILPATGGAKKREHEAPGCGTSTARGGSGRLLVAWASPGLGLELAR